MEPQFLHLLPELRAEILSKLPLRVFLTCRCVCKTLCADVDEIRFSKLHLTKIFRPDYTTSCSTFIVCKRRKSNDYYFVNNIDGRFVVTGCQKIELPVKNMWIWNISRELVFLQRSKLKCVGSLVNGEFVKLLELDPSRINGIHMFGMGYNVPTREFKVVHVFSYYRDQSIEPLHSLAKVFTLGNSRRKKIGIVPFKYLYGRSVCVNGSLHWVATGTLRPWETNNIMYISSFNLNSEEFEDIPGPIYRAFNGEIEGGRFELGVLEGLLALTDCMSNEGRLDIWVLMNYDVNKVWSRQYAIRLNCLIQWPLCHVRPLCYLDNGEVLLQLHYGDLIAYNPENGYIKIVQIVGLEAPCSLTVFPISG